MPRKNKVQSEFSSDTSEMSDNALQKKKEDLLKMAKQFKSRRETYTVKALRAFLTSIAFIVTAYMGHAYMFIVVILLIIL